MLPYAVKGLDEHLANDGQPKRILALDGGGVRGVVAIEYLRKIEGLLRARYRAPDLRLSHYFDLIAGTSTGSIIASMLALGASVDEISKKYQDLAGQVFRRNYFRWGALRYKFDKSALEKALQANLGDRALGSPDIQTGLLVVVKRFDTNSLWPLNNNPRGAFYEAEPQAEFVSNNALPLWQIVRASCAAPTYFKPERIVVAHAEIDGKKHPLRGHFVDGGVSVANNPALQALMTATLRGYNLNWSMGPDKILLVSIGTGYGSSNQSTSYWSAASHAVAALVSVLDDSSVQNETILQWISRSPTARRIDGEMGSLREDVLGTELISYLRYNLHLDAGWIRNHLSMDYSQDVLHQMTLMDNAAVIGDLGHLAQAAADVQVYDEHFTSQFDLA